MTTRKPIDKDYLLETLRSFNLQVLQNTYVTSSDIKEFIEKIESSSGKNVQIAKIEPIIGGNRVTFAYYDDSNVQKTSSMEVMNGETGTSIVDAKITANNMLILELSDGSIINAGQIIINSNTLTLEDYYTIEQTDEKFVQKLELDTLVQNYLDSNFAPIESKDIHKLF